MIDQQESTKEYGITQEYNIAIRLNTGRHVWVGVA